MTSSRISTAAVAFFLASLACEGVIGPGADGAPYLLVTVNDTSWTMVGPTLTLVEGQLTIGGSYRVPNANLTYSLRIAANPFTGRGVYALEGLYGNQAVYLLAVDTVDHGPSPSDFVADSSDPGGIEIAEYRESDSTVVGTFHARLHGVTTPGVGKYVVGSFRARATN